MFAECILESLERENYVSNIYTWKFGVTWLLFLLLSNESATLEGQTDGQMDWPFPQQKEGDFTPQEDLELVTHSHSYC